MKKILYFFAFTLSTGISLSWAQNTNLYWDPNFQTNGIGGSGSWTTTGTNWTTNATGNINTISGNWVNGANWTNAASSVYNAIIQGSNGTVWVPSSVRPYQLQILNDGYTLARSNSGTSNVYLNVRNGIIVPQNVTVGLTATASNNGSSSGVLGVMGTITNSSGNTSYGTVAVTGDSGVLPGYGIRIGTRTTNEGSGAVDWYVNVNVKTTGSNGAVFHTMDANSTNRIRGTITIDNGSRLYLSPGPISTRTIIAYGNIISATNNALFVGEATNTGWVQLRGSNTITGDIPVYGQLSYQGSLNAFGTAVIVLKSGAIFGQSGSITDGSLTEVLANNMRIEGTNVTFGGFGNSCYFGGNIDLNGGVPTINMNNSTTLSGAMTNGSLVFTNSSAARTMTFNGPLRLTNLIHLSVGTSSLNGTNSISNLVVSNGIVVIGAGGSNSSIGSYTVNQGSLSAPHLGIGSSALTLQGIGGTAVFSNTATSAFLAVGPLNLSGSNNLAMNTAGSFSVASSGSITLAGSGNTINLTGAVLASGATYTLVSGTSVNTNGLTGPVTLSGSAVNNAPGLRLNGPSITSGVNIYTFRSTATTLELQVDPNLALNLSWNGGASGNWNTEPANMNWTDGGTPSAFSTGNNALIDTASSAVSLTLDAAGITAGYVTVSGGNNAATLSGGTLTAISLATTGSDLVVDSSCTVTNLSVTNANISGSGTITTTAGATVQSDFDNTFAARVAGVGGFTKTGGGTLTLSAAGSYSGDTTVSSGILNTSQADLIPDNSTLRLAANGSAFQLGGNEAVAAIIAVSGSTLNLSGFDLTVGGTGLSFTNTATVLGNGGRMIKNGGGLLWLNNAANTFSGGFVLNAGEVALTTSGNYGTDGVVTNTVFGTGPLTLNGGILRSSSPTSGRNIANEIIVNNNIQFGAVGAEATITVNATAGKSTTFTTNLTVTTVADVSWEQPISGANLALTKAGTNVMSLRGNTTLGSLIIQQGSLHVRSTNNFTNVLVGTGAGLGYGGTNMSASGHFGACDLILSNGAAIGQIATNGLNTEPERWMTNRIVLLGNAIFGLGNFSSYFKGDINLSGGIRTVGLTNSTYVLGSVTNGGLIISNISATRTLYLNASNSYAGGTTHGGGVLSLGDDSGLGTGGLTISSNTATTTLTATDGRNITNPASLALGSVLVMDSGSTNSPTSTWTYNGPISGFGAITKQGVGTLTLAGALNYTGGTTVSAGALVVVTNNISASLSSNTIAITFSNTPANGTYAVLPGALTGTYTATYNNLGSSQKATFSTASPASVTVASKSSQSITGLAATDTKTTADTAYALSVTPGASTGSLTFSSDKPAVATVSTAGVVTIVGAGTTTLRVNQAGDANYLAAAEVTQILTVTSAGPTFETAYPGVNLADVAPNGLTYLVNYAFGGSSTSAAKLPEQDATDPTKLKLVAYVRTNNAAGTITVKGQKGSSLSSWDANLIDGVPAGDNNGAPEGTQKQIFSVDANGDRQFLRLKVTK